MDSGADSGRFDKERGDYHAIRCANCKLFYDDTLVACPNCGVPNPEPVHAQKVKPEM